ncbi:hypothetical protein PVK06_041199 [Gossypium arboreum]|uniref:RNase H type-1 domain-containing protein n=1 Tax=Gossypium arboreum TaxID=29729 RepID=A0ABR0N7J1_GOSAR|nr:hypothetical protein PVK06_041199 [Gossypium arboreum]
MFEFELWGILDGLTILNEWIYDRVLIHTDSMEVIKVIEDRQSADANSALVRKTKQLLKYRRLWFFRYVSKKNNRVANGIAKLIFNNKEGVQNFEEIPKETLQDLGLDKANGFFYF